MSSPSQLGQGAVGIQIPEGGPQSLNIAQIEYEIATVGELKVDAVFLRYAAVPSDPSREVKMPPTIPIEIVFGQGTPAELERVIPLLEAACDFVRDAVITPLSHYL
jgi:hypothetical protein